MIAAELRGGHKPSLNEALGWIGSRVDDIYGANVGRLEDVWIDPGTGVPRWLLVKEGRFGGRTTLIPFEDATAGAGHVWVPYEREVVRDAPEIAPGAPLTQQVEAALRSHYAANAPASMAQRGAPPAPLHRPPQPGSAMGTATIRFAGAPEAGSPAALGFEAPRQADRPPQSGSAHSPPAPPRRHVLREQPAAPQPPTPDQRESAFQQPRMPQRPAPPVQAQTPQPPQQPAFAPPSPSFPQPQARLYEPPAGTPPAYAPPLQPPQPQPVQGWQTTQPPPAPQAFQPQPQPQPAAPPRWEEVPAPDPAQGPVEALRSLAEAGGSHYVEIELSGELTIRGELRSVRVTPRQDPPPQR